MKIKCQQCKYYIKHYIKKRFKFVSINCGHCIKTKKLKQGCADFCALDVKHEQQTDELLMKEYLKILIDRVEDLTRYIKD